LSSGGRNLPAATTGSQGDITDPERQQLSDQRRAILEELRGRQADLERLSAALAKVATPLVVLAAAVWVGLLSLANVRQRRAEIGLLRALGKSSTTIASLLLGKAVLLARLLQQS
jgi:predicted lysophospholipase L1 biosynthesis ABC-type transport system permease subunit